MRIHLTGLVILVMACDNPMPTLEQHRQQEHSVVDNYRRNLSLENRRRRHRVDRYVEVMESYTIGAPSRELLVEIAEAIYDDAKTTGLPGEFYLALMRVENPWLDPHIENFYGAVGLTQVVPRYWDGVYEECGESLRDVFTQICYASRIYLHYLEQAGGDSVMALYAYNGCTEWHRETEQRCINYPHWIRQYETNYREAM